MLDDKYNCAEMTDSDQRRGLWSSGDALHANAAMDRITLGKRVRELRVKAKLTQDDLADAVGVTRNAVSLIERGRGYPSADKLFAIARALKTPIGAFFAFMGEEDLSNDRRGKLVALMDSARLLDDRMLEVAVKQVQVLCESPPEPPPAPQRQKPKPKPKK